jgi:hypothetical protein
VATMVRKQIYLKPSQDEEVKRLAAELGISEAEFIRSAIEKRLETLDRERRAADAWAEIEHFIRTERMFDAPQTGRDWTRDDLYAERPDRYSR